MRRKHRHRNRLQSKTGGVLPVFVLAVLITWPVHRAEPTTGPENALKRPQVTAIQVEGGRAQFSLAGTESAGRYLVVSSAFAHKGGPFPIRLTARPSSVWTPPTEATLPARPNRERSASPASSTTIEPPPLPPSERTFSLLVKDGDPASPGNYAAVTARLRAVGLHVQVYVATEDESQVSADTLRDLVATFDREVWPKANRMFGTARDVDQDGRFTVLLTGWLGRFASGRQPLDGFVRGADFDRKIRAPLGNGCDILYLNAALKTGPHLRTILAHEYTHAVVFSRKVLDAPGTDDHRDEEDWLDEALAHLVEDQHGFSRSNLEHRVSAFLTNPERYRLIVEDYFRGNLFRSHGHRGAAYLFLRWCQDNYGPELLPTLVTSQKKGVSNVESATGEAVETLFRRWSVDLVGMPVWSPDVVKTDAKEGLPTLHWITPGGETDCGSAEATTTQFTVVEMAESGVVEVNISAPCDANLQVSLIPLPDNYPRLELQPVSQQEITNPGSVNLVHAGGMTVQISSVRFEPLLVHSRATNSQGILEYTQDELDQVFGPDHRLQPGTTIALEPPLSHPKFNTPHRLVVQATDPSGCPVTVQAEFTP